MIKLIEKGSYKLFETKHLVKILKLNKKNFVWINAPSIGEILVSSHKSHRADYILSSGKYRIYEVKDEPQLTDLLHLELLVGEGLWQGYLLPVGMPNGVKRRKIIPTKEIITKTFPTRVLTQV